MKSTGIVRKVDDLGRIVLPKELRRVLKIEEKDALEIYVEEDRIILKKYNPGCKYCGTMDGLIRALGEDICTSCISIINQKLKSMPERSL